MSVYFFDPAPPTTTRRPWAQLLGSCRECVWSTENLSFAIDNATIDSGLVIVHDSKLSTEGIETREVEDYCRVNEAVTVVIVSGGGRTWTSDVPNLYFREKVLGYDSNDPFATCFSRFRVNLERTGERLFRLLDPETPVLLSLAIICQAYAAAAVLNGEIKLDDEFLKKIGWNALPGAATVNISGRIGHMWPKFERIEWWWGSLGLTDEGKNSLNCEKYRMFLTSLILETGLENDIRQKIDTELINLPRVILFDFLESQSLNVVKDIIALLNQSRVKVDTVKTAYLSIVDFTG